MMTVPSADPTMPTLRAADHERFESALKEVRARIGLTYGLMIGGEELEARRLRTQHSPTDLGRGGEVT